MVRKILHFFDKLEDHIRGALSRFPILYAFFGGTGIILFWRGVWDVADAWHVSGFASILIGSFVLLATGLFVSVFIGDQVIISGLRGEKKLAEKTEQEVEIEEGALQKVHAELHGLSKRLSRIEKSLHTKESNH